MAITIGSAADMKGLATSFQTSITAIVAAESEPIKRIQTQRDEIDVRKGIYTDIKTNLDALQGAVQALISSQGSFALGQVAKSTISGTGTNVVLTATTSETSSMGTYDVAVTSLAKAQVRSTAAVANSSLALGKSGTFWMGGTGMAEINLASPSDALTAVATSEAASDQKELGTGTYSLQTRLQDGVRQFRLVDSDGNGVSIRNINGSGYTTGWQAGVDDTVDTGRGLTLTLSSSGTAATTDFSYTAKGTSVEITTADSLQTIVTKINAASQPDGHALTASVVSGRLVLTGAQTGVNHGMIYSMATTPDGEGLDFGADVLQADGKTYLFTAGVDMQAAQNASFTVNGMAVSRGSNTELADVIEGSTINLAADAEGKTARITIGVNTDKAVTAVNAFVTKFNAAFTHLTNKMALTSKMEGTKTTYTRGPLSGDQGFRALRMDLFNQVNKSVTTGGSLSSLADIGISYDKDMKLTLDITKFTTAFKSSSSNVVSLLDGAMGQFNTLLTRYAGTSGSVQSSLTSMDDQIKGYEQRISKYTESLTSRRQALIDQYFQYQTQLANMGYQAQMFGITLGSTNSSSINLLG